MKSRLRYDEHPVPQLVHDAVAWLAQNAHENLGTEIVLRNLHSGDGWHMTFVRTGTDFQGVSVVTPAGMWFLEATSQAVAEILVGLTRARHKPRKLTVSGKVRPWVRPMLLERWQIQREHDLLAMVCNVANESSASGVGRPTRISRPSSATRPTTTRSAARPSNPTDQH